MSDRFSKYIGEIINSEKQSMTYGYLELLFLSILEKKVTSQGKSFIKESGYDYGFDGLAPEGFDSYIGATAIEIKFFRNISSVKKNIYSRLHRELNRATKLNAFNKYEIKNYIFIIPMDIEQSTLKEINEKIGDVGVQVYIWGNNEIDELIKPYERYFYDTINNIGEFVLDIKVKDSIHGKSDDWKKQRETHLKNLKKEYSSDDIVLFLGSGTSMDAKIPTWNNLMSDMFVSLLRNKLNENSIKITNKEKDIILDNLMEINGDSPLLQARFIRKGLEEKFIDILTEVLYKNCCNTSSLLTELAKLCVPSRGATGIQAVVTYNFDDLLEYNFKNERIRYKSIYQDHETLLKEELGIYHVHGFLPRDRDQYENLTKNLLVFSEEGYHTLYLDPYHWANLTQLNFLREKTALFIGLSMTDPNLRRLLDIAISNNPNEDKCKHYAILKWNSFKDRDQLKKNSNIENIDTFERTARTIQEDYFKELGVNVIWIEKYEEIPEIIKSLNEY